MDLESKCDYKDERGEGMKDEQIVQLYWDRDQQAIPVTAEKYGKYCATIARNILENREDVEECLNDTWLGAWDSMPPHRPRTLPVFLGKITRNLSFSRFRRDHAEKRGGGELPLVLDELDECVSGQSSVEDEYDRKELLEAINEFLDALPREKQVIFVCRYWYADCVGDIAARLGMTESHVSMTLTRLRRKLCEHLTKGGFKL